MATKKKSTQAEKATASKKSTTSAKSTKEKMETQKAASSVKTESVRKESAKKERIPIRVITSLVFLALFVIFLVVLLKPDGVLTKFVYQYVILGLFGSIAFYISVPALLYLFFIHAFSGKRPVIMRSICLGAFVLICGCISHLLMPTGEIGKGFKFISDLYMGGINGNTAGLICGSCAMLLKLLLGQAITLIVLIVAAVLTLLGSMQITIPSIVRAVKNRPRADWEDEAEREEKPEPATLVVNHLAKKRIEYVENKARHQEEQLAFDMDAEQKPKKKHGKLSKGDEIMRQIEDDVEQPVAASEKPFEMDPAPTYTPAPIERPKIQPGPKLEEKPVKLHTNHSSIRETNLSSLQLKL